MSGKRVKLPSEKKKIKNWARGLVRGRERQTLSLTLVLHPQSPFVPLFFLWWPPPMSRHRLSPSPSTLSLPLPGTLSSPRPLSLSGSFSFSLSLRVRLRAKLRSSLFWLLQLTCAGGGDLEGTEWLGGQLMVMAAHATLVVEPRVHGG